MPYASIEELPSAVREAYSERCQRVFMRVWNDNATDEQRAFAIAHTAAKDCEASKSVWTLDDGATLSAVDPLKAERIGRQAWRVNALPFGGPLKGRDLQGDYFSPRTDPKPDWFPEVPVDFHHSWDPIIKSELLGRAGKLEREDDGWWREFWLDRQSQYFGRIERLLEDGKLYGSSAAIPHMVKKAQDGEILQWVPYAQTLSPVPINPYSVVTPAKAFPLFDQAGIHIDPTMRSILTDLDTLQAELAEPKAGRVLSAYSESKLRTALKELEEALSQLDRYMEAEPVKAEWSAAYINGLPDSAFACIDSAGRHYPHHDAAGKLDMAHLRNAMSRVNQEATTSCGKGHLMEHAKAMGMGES